MEETKLKSEEVEAAKVEKNIEDELVEEFGVLTNVCEYCYSAV